MSKDVTAGKKPLHIAIDARLPMDGSCGGVSHITTSLIKALAELDSPNERYSVLVHPHSASLYANLGGGGIRLIEQSEDRVKVFSQSFRKRLHHFPLASRILSAAQRLQPAKKPTAKGIVDPFLEDLGSDLVHFTFQRYFSTRIPSVYNPHDLQHRHFPHFFTRQEIAQREWQYQLGCRQATQIAVSSSWVKQDLVQQFGTPAGKIHVIPWGIDDARPACEQAAVDEIRDRFGSVAGAGSYALYPAVTWEHKNHLRLLDAIALLRDQQDIRLNLVCTGHKTKLWHTIQQQIHQLKLDKQVHFSGVVPARQLHALYKNSLCVVIPSLFEASSAVMREAWRWGTPVVSANITSLPMQAGDAALLFDPLKPEMIAAALRSIIKDPGVRIELIGKGDQRLAQFPWQLTAKGYRALYRHAAGDTLNEEDLNILKHDWMSCPAIKMGGSS